MGLMAFSGEQPTFGEAKVAKSYRNQNELPMVEMVAGYVMEAIDNIVALFA
ncbi:MAG: hypothetical protein RSE25_10420 [Bacteroidales bacterium]